MGKKITQYISFGAKKFLIDNSLLDGMAYYKICMENQGLVPLFKHEEIFGSNRGFPNKFDFEKIILRAWLPIKVLQEKSPVYTNLITAPLMIKGPAICSKNLILEMAINLKNADQIVPNKDLDINYKNINKSNKLPLLNLNKNIKLFSLYFGPTKGENEAIQYIDY